MKPQRKKNEQSLDKESGIRRVLNELMLSPNDEFSLSELAEKAGISKPNMGGILKQLQEKGLVQISKLATIWRIQANTQNWEFRKRKIATNISGIYESGVVEFLANTFNNPKAIILFGSFRRGEDGTNSDIDIAIEDEKKEGILSTSLDDLLKTEEEKQALRQYESQTRRRIQIHFFNRKKVDQNVFKNIANGVVLWGFLEVKP